MSRRGFENLEDGMTVDEIIAQYPVSREEIKAVLDFAAHSLDKAPSFQGTRAKRSAARNSSWPVWWCAPHPLRF